MPGIFRFTQQSSAFAAALGALIVSSPAHANTIGSVTASPPQVSVNQDVTITVIRSGPINCAASLDYGDGSAPYLFTLSASPEVVTHQYTSSGTYTVTAGPGNGIINCENTMQDTVTVTGGGGGRFQAAPAPGRNISRKPSRPEAVIAPERRITNMFDTRILSMDDPAVDVLTCGDDANSNTCNDEGSEANDCVFGVPFTTGPGGKTVTIFGNHSNCGWIGDDEGTDRYRITLANGWFINRIVEQEVHGTSSDESANFSSIPTGESATSATIDVEWLATPSDGVSYWLILEVKGPKGTMPF